MIVSMTGYGKSEFTNGEMSISVEFRTVNSRFLDFTPKTPRIFITFDDELTALIKKYCVRGKVMMNTNVDFDGNNHQMLSLDTDKLQKYLNIAAEIQKEMGTSESISPEHFMNINDIYSTADIEIDDNIKENFLNTVQAALKELNTVREFEGHNLKKDLESRLQTIENVIGEITKYSEFNKENDLEALKKKLYSITDNLQLDDNRLLQEIVIVAEKKDISEELIRLNSHVELFNSYFDDKNHSGKKMSFLLQEMNREVNTIGSKSQHVKINHMVVDIKDELEKIREQVQNIL